ncbi:MAG: 1-acyl-sn-glycerol-3-phosphate acyltransferase [Nitriliruptoraceae bacterium]|nr:1-acyl-sn-glycerol-3-phosphate acyltransferase [Nitriliruptoraceae bacterium]
MGALYRTGSVLFRAGFRLLRVDLRVAGHEHIPRTGPAVIASNHIGYLDFAFVVLAPPTPRREVRFMARSEFFHIPVAGTLLRGLGQIPVDVHGSPTEAAAEARAALERGELVGVHPEGTISPSFVPRRAKSGAVRLAESAGAPIVPCAVWGTQRLLTKGRPARPTLGATVMVRYGEAFVPQGRTGMAKSRELMTRIEALLAESQAAYPQRPAGPSDRWWLPAHLGGDAPTVEEAEARLRAQDEERRARRLAS